MSENLIPTVTYLAPEDFDLLVAELDRPPVACPALREAMLRMYQPHSLHLLEDVLDELGIDVSDE